MKALILVIAFMGVEFNGLEANENIVYLKADFQHAIYKYSKKSRLNSGIALSVAEVESSWNPKKERQEKKGNTVSVGLFQMYYPTAQEYGYKGTPDGLKNPDVNIKLGVKHLARCQAKYGADVRRVACCHNAGIHIRDSVCVNDPWVIHYENKVEKAFQTYRGVKL